MEESFFRCIPQRKIPLLLYPTTEENIFHCGIQRKKPAALWDTMLKNFLGYSTLHKILLWCRIHRRKISCVMGYKRKNLFAILKLFSVVSHNGKNPLLLYPTMEENLLRCIPQLKKLFRCIPQRKESSFVVSHNGGKPSPLYPTAKKLFRCIPQRKKISSVVSHYGQKM